MHIAEADGVTRLTAVEACFFSNRNSNVIAKRIYDRCADTATCGASGHDETVAVEQIQIAHQVTSEECAGLLFINYDVLRLRPYFGNYCVGIDSGI